MKTEGRYQEGGYQAGETQTKILANIGLGFIGMFIAIIYAYNELVKKTDIVLSSKRKQK